MSKTILIGRDASNDVHLEVKAVSRQHAQLRIEDNGTIVLKDLGSTNGTYVNGQRIVGPQILKPGDKVYLANVPFDWEGIVSRNLQKAPQAPVMQKKQRKLWPWILGGCAAAIAIIGGVFAFMQRTWSPEKIFETYEHSVILVHSGYTYDVTYSGDPVSEYLSGDTRLDHVYWDSKEEMLRPGSGYSTGTGFFVSTDGKIITNRHVIFPDADLKKKVENEVRQILSSWGKATIAQGIEVKPRNTALAIAHNGLHLRDVSDLQSCTLIDASTDENIDLAIIQANNKMAPNNTNIISLSRIAKNKDIRLGKELFSIGFPYSTIIGLTDIGLQANNQKGNVTQMTGKYIYGNNIPVISGASGSPVFDKKGRLAGVVVSGWNFTQGYNYAILPDVIKQYTDTNL